VGETVEVALSVSTDDLRYYDAAAGCWRFEPGVYRIFVGPCADDARLLTALIEL
jgi:hypothetical protein